MIFSDKFVPFSKSEEIFKVSKLIWEKMINFSDYAWALHILWHLDYLLLLFVVRSQKCHPNTMPARRNMYSKLAAAAASSSFVPKKTWDASSRAKCCFEVASLCLNHHSAEFHNRQDFLTYRFFCLFLLIPGTFRLVIMCLDKLLIIFWSIRSIFVLFWPLYLANSTYFTNETSCRYLTVFGHVLFIFGL